VTIFFRIGEKFGKIVVSFSVDKHSQASPTLAMLSSAKNESEVQLGEA